MKGIGIIIALIWALTPEDAFAWGPAIHTMFAVNILDGRYGPLGHILELISSYPYEFIYGSLALDFQLKGGQITHSHTWEHGFRILRESSSPLEKAYAYGFLAHLAADVPAHNYFIPRVLKEKDLNNKVKHLLWEIRIDRWMAKEYMGFAEYIIRREHQLCDELITGEEPLQKRIFELKKQLYQRGLSLSRFFPSLKLGFYLYPGHKTKYLFATHALALSRYAIEDIFTRLNHSPFSNQDPLGGL